MAYSQRDQMLPHHLGRRTVADHPSKQEASVQADHSGQITF